jgi:hypothetical protein
MYQDNIFIYFLKIIFAISTSKRLENIKKKLIKKIKIFKKHDFNRVPKPSTRATEGSLKH